MKAYLSAHLLLAPLMIVTIFAPLGYPLLGASIGLAVGVVSCLHRYGNAMPPVFMIAQVIGVLAVLIAILMWPTISETNALAILFAFLAGGAFVSVIQYKPWTAELSAADVGDFATHPSFIKSNIFFSGMWMLVFAWFSYANWQELSPIYRWVPMIVGGLITIVGPKILMSIGIKRGLIEKPPNR